MGSNKHKHKSRKRKGYRSSDSSEKEYDRGDKHRHHKKHHRDRKEKLDKPILVDDYDSSNSEDDVIIVEAPPPPKISHRSSPPPRVSHRSPPPRRSSVSPRRKIAKTSHVEAPPPPKISRHKSPSPVSSTHIESKTSSDASLSIEETNKLRLKLGLKPLKVGYEKAPRNEHQKKKETFGGTDMGDFVHKPPENISAKSYTEKLKEKLKLQREKRQVDEKLRKVKKLDEDSDDDDVTKWVQKNRKVVSQRQQAEIRTKELDAMDEVFGIDELIQEDIRATKNKAYTAKDLKGLKVEHEMDTFKEGKAVILTLKDANVLDEDDDTLVNVNMVDEERYKKNIDRRRLKPNYNAFDDEYAEIEADIDKKILQKYDEEIDGVKQKSFELGITKAAQEEARKESIRKKLQQHAVGKRLENLSFVMQPAAEFYTEEEISVKFKKIKKKIRKIRKVKPLKADDLLSGMPAGPSERSIKRESRDDVSDDQNGHANAPPRAKKMKTEPKGEPYDTDPLDVDDMPPPPAIDLHSIKIDVNEDDDLDLQLALHRTRKLRQLATMSTADDKMDSHTADNETEEQGAAGSIVLNSTAEFCRTLGDIPTYGQAGNREEDAQELMDCDQELKSGKTRIDDLDALTSGWNEVAVMDVTPIDVTTAEVPILDVEPDICSGVAGALKMAIHKGYIQTESEKRPSASRFAHLQAQNYSIDDKAHAYEDDKHSRRERYCGMTSEFKDKDGYKPNVKLEYIDDDGHLLSAKEAFRYLSHKFHGKGPGKNKIEKRMKKNEQEALMKQMSSTDTPLGTLNMLQQKQKETQSPFVVLSGSKQGQPTNIAKLRF